MNNKYIITIHYVELIVSISYIKLISNITSMHAGYRTNSKIKSNI